MSLTKSLAQQTPLQCKEEQEEKLKAASIDNTYEKLCHKEKQKWDGSRMDIWWGGQMFF